MCRFCPLNVYSYRPNPYMHKNIAATCVLSMYRGAVQRQKILMFIYPIYNHNWRNMSTIYIYIYIYIYICIYKTKLTSKEIFSPSNKIHREIGRAKDLSAPPYIYTYMHAYIHTRIYIHACVHNTYVHTYSYIHTYIHTYINTNTHTFESNREH